MSESRPFTVEFGGVCNLCGKWVERDSQAHMVDGKFAHEFCHEDREGEAFKSLPERSGDFGYEYGDSSREIPYVKSGGRNNEKRCPTCFLTHAGECM